MGSKVGGKRSGCKKSEVKGGGGRKVVHPCSEQHF